MLYCSFKVEKSSGEKSSATLFQLNPSQNNGNYYYMKIYNFCFQKKNILLRPKLVVITKLVNFVAPNRPPSAPSISISSSSSPAHHLYLDRKSDRAGDFLPTTSYQNPSMPKSSTTKTATSCRRRSAYEQRNRAPEPEKSERVSDPNGANRGRSRTLIRCRRGAHPSRRRSRSCSAPVDHRYSPSA